MLRLSILLVASSMFVGCTASHHGFLLKPATGERGTVIFHDEPNGKHGTVEAILANGEQCRGQFNTIPDQVTRNWEDHDDIESEDTQLGVAAFQCADSHVVKCDFSRAHEGSGSGRCLDNLGQKYTLEL